MALATSNLSVNSIITTLGVASPKAIFRNFDGSLKTANELWSVVNKWGLSLLCPGITSDNKLANLLADRKLSYFKGYNHDKDPMGGSGIFVNSTGGIASIDIICALADYNWYYYDKTVSWISIGSSNNHTGNFSFLINLTQNTGAQRSGYVRFRGEPKFYNSADFELEIEVVQADGLA